MSLPLPPQDIRMNSLREREDEIYLRTAKQLASAMGSMVDLDRFSAKTKGMPRWANLSILDFGCGTARLLAGLETVDRLPKKYIGLDVQQKLIDWLDEAIAPAGNYTFQKIEMHNARYNPSGKRPGRNIIPNEYAEIDLVVARSVFTHMTEADIAACLREFRRVIRPNGRAYVTVNVRNGVPNWTDNPEKPDAPPLLKVELNKTYFENMLEQSGFYVSAFVESVENQCVYLLRP